MLYTFKKPLLYVSQRETKIFCTINWIESTVSIPLYPNAFSCIYFIFWKSFRRGGVPILISQEHKSYSLNGCPAQIVFPFKLSVAFSCRWISPCPVLEIPFCKPKLSKIPVPILPSQDPPKSSVVLQVYLINSTVVPFPFAIVFLADESQPSARNPVFLAKIRKSPLQF
jgi:hypothetical protein